MAKVAIIGAGITGLTCALRLSEYGHDVTVFEKGSSVGGLVDSVKFNTETVESIYHHIFTSDTYVHKLLAELKLTDSLKYYFPSNALRLNHRLYPFSSALDLLRCNALPLLDRIRTGLCVLKAGRIDDYLSLESELASSWLIRHGGKATYECLWQPLLASKFGEAANSISAVWIWNKFKLRGNSRQKNQSHESLGYLDGGFGTLINALAELIQMRGVDLHTNSKVINLEPIMTTPTPQWLVSTATAITRFDGVVVAIADALLPDLLGLDTLDAEYATKLKNSRWVANICLLLQLKQSISPYYWTTVCDKSPYVAVIEHTNLLNRQIDHSHLVYLSRYLETSSELWCQDDATIIEIFLNELFHQNLDLHASDIILQQLVRTPFAQPVVMCNHSSNYAESDTPIATLKLASMAQIYPEDRGINYAIRLAETVSAKLNKELS